jgi:hypothetical protein
MGAALGVAALGHEYDGETTLSGRQEAARAGTLGFAWAT